MTRPATDPMPRRGFISRAARALLGAHLAAGAAPHAFAASPAPASGARVRFRRITMRAARLDDQRRFYTETFGLPLVTDHADGFVVRAGDSELEFLRDHRAESPVHHFAFNVPENRFAEAKAWLAARVPLARAPDGRDEFHFESWNADAAYYFDPAGNIGELIARHTLPDSRADTFDAARIEGVSEFAIVVADTAGAKDAIGASFGLGPYGQGAEEFRAVGDERGLFIIVRAGRRWFPTETPPAAPFESGALIRAAAADPLELPEGRCVIRASAS